MNGSVDIAIKEKRRLWNSWKQGGSKEDYLKVKTTAERTVYDAKRAAEVGTIRNIEMLKR